MAIEHLVITFNSDGGKVDIAMNGKEENIKTFDAGRSAKYSGKVFLCKEKGMKLNYIRVIYMFCCLGFFTDGNGKKSIYKDVFKDFGAVIGEDLSDYNNHLSRSQIGRAHV